MPQKTSPFLEGKWGWNYGESGWNSGMDENLLKFSFLFDSNVEAIVASLPAAVNGKAYFLTTDNRIYYAVDGAYSSTPVPKWFEFKIKSTGELYRFTGSSVEVVPAVQDLESRVDVLESDFSSLGSAAFQDSSTFTTQVDLVDAITTTKGAALVGGLIAQDITINVPAQYATIAAAMDYLRKYTIARDATATIQVADGSYTLTGSINLNHPQGGKIRLIGNQINPNSCILTVADSATFDAIVCSNGNVFGLLDGFTITRPLKAEVPINTTAILALRNSTIICGTSIRVSKWFYGLAARDNSYIYCPSAQVDQAGDVGIWAYVGSTVVCDGAQSTNTSAAGNPWGFGFQAEFGSTLAGTGLIATGCKIGGIAALSNSTLRVPNAQANNNVGSGFFARDGGMIEVGNGTATGNGGWGVEILNGGGRVTGVVTLSGNTLGNNNPKPALSVESGQARVFSTDGPLRVDATGNNSVFVNTGGGLQFSVSNVASAANRLDVIGAPTGSFPSVRAIGSDTNIDIQVTPKGAGVFRIPDGTWNGRHFVLGIYHIWADGSGRLRIKNSAPTSDTDGTVVGTQS